MLLFSIDAAVQRSLLIVSLVTGVLVLVGMLYRVVRRVDLAVTRVEDQVKPNGSAKDAGTQDLTTRDLIDKMSGEIVSLRHDLNKVRRRNDERHKENRADMHELSDGFADHLANAEGFGADVNARLAVLEDRSHDDRPPRLEMKEDD